MPNSRTKLENDLETVVQPYIRRHAEATFFEAMKEGYASKPEKGSIGVLPGSKTIDFTLKEWRVLDMYLVTPQSSYSSGMTVMWFGDIPIWTMQYGGYYDEEAIPCLKAALRANYVNHVFNGGRGPDFFEHEGFHYLNRVMSNNFHGRTNGQEIIFDSQQKLRGVHLYQSWWMVNDR